MLDRRTGPIARVQRWVSWGLHYDKAGGMYKVLDGWEGNDRRVMFGTYDIAEQSGSVDLHHVSSCDGQERSTPGHNASSAVGLPQFISTRFSQVPIYRAA